MEMAVAGRSVLAAAATESVAAAAGVAAGAANATVVVAINSPSSPVHLSLEPALLLQPQAAAQGPLPAMPRCGTAVGGGKDCSCIGASGLQGPQALGRCWARHRVRGRAHDSSALEIPDADGRARSMPSSCRITGRNTGQHHAGTCPPCEPYPSPSGLGPKGRTTYSGNVFYTSWGDGVGRGIRWQI